MFALLKTEAGGGQVARTKGTVTTKYEIIQVASKMFMELGYSNTYPRLVAEELGIKASNIIYYFPTKEHLLLAVVEMLCDFQYKMLEGEAGSGNSSVTAICLETMTVAVACDESEIARDLFINAFQGELCRNYLRHNHVERAKKILAKECAGRTDEQFHEAEILVMGLQYAAIIPTDANVPVKTRIAGALNQILSIYNVDEETRKREIESVLAKDCRGISKRVLSEFTDYIETTSHQALKQAEEKIKNKRQRNRLMIL